MKKIASSILLMVSLFCANVLFAAEPPLWKIVPAHSSLAFIATQNGAPVKGEFKKFTGEIHFDLNQLKDSKVKITVDMSSLATSYEDLTVTLKTPDWFNQAAYPQAVFESTEISKVADKQYQAKGNLTIRNKTLPVTLNFTVTQPTQSNIMATGYTTLKRTVFGVGQGEWSSVNEVKDDVRVDFVVNATK